MSDQLSTEEKQTLELVRLKVCLQDLSTSLERLMVVCRYELGYTNWQFKHPFLNAILPDKVKRKLYVRGIRKSIS